MIQSVNDPRKLGPSGPKADIFNIRSSRLGRMSCSQDCNKGTILRNRYNIRPQRSYTNMSDSITAATASIIPSPFVQDLGCVFQFDVFTQHEYFTLAEISYNKNSLCYLKARWAFEHAARKASQLCEPGDVSGFKKHFYAFLIPCYRLYDYGRYYTWCFPMYCTVGGAFTSFEELYHRFYDSQTVSDLGVLEHIVHQSGDRKYTRYEREVEQRAAAKAHLRAELKSLPKDVREAFIKAERDKRSTVLQSGLTNSIGIIAGVLGIKLFSNLSRLIKKADSSVDMLTSQVTSLVSDLKGVFTAVRDKFAKLNMNFFWKVPAVVISWTIINKFQLPQILNVALLALIAKELGPGLWKHISSFFPSSKIVLQSGIDITSSLSKLVSTVFCFSIFRDGVASARHVTEFMKRVSMVGRVGEGIKDIMEWLTLAMQALINGVLSLFGSTRLDFVKRHRSPVLDWSRRVESIQLKMETKRDEDVNGYIDSLVLLLNEGSTYAQAFRLDKEVGRCIEINMARLYSLLLPYQGVLSSRQNFRVEPECAILCGDPGIGKTLLCTFLCLQVMVKSGLLPPGSSPATAKANIWQKGSSKFWNGYASPFCVVMDDFFQSKAEPSDPENEAMMLIRAISSFAYPLDFADVNSKGKFYFSSKFVLGTTNQSCFGDVFLQYVRDPAAVLRRIHHPYKVIVNKEFALEDGKLNYDKFVVERERCRSLGTFPWYVWSAQMIDYNSGQIGATVPFQTVVDTICDKLRVKLSNHKSGEQVFDDVCISMLEAESNTVVQSGKILDDVELSDCEEKYDVLAPSECVDDPKFKPTEELSRLLDVKNFLTSFSGSARPWFQKLLMGSAAAGVVLALVPLAWIAVKAICEAFFNTLSATVGLFTRPFRRKATALQSNVKVKTKGRGTSVLQSGDPNVVSNVYNNTYKMIIVQSDGFIPVGQIIFLNSTLAVQPEHFSSYGLLIDGQPCAETDEVRFVSCCNDKFSFSLTVSQYKALPRYTHKNKDVEFIDFVNVRSHKNIESAFLTEKQLRYADGVHTRYEVARVKPVAGGFDTTRVSLVNQKSLYKQAPHFFSGRVLERYFAQRAVTEHGDCGAPLLLFDSSTFGGAVAFGMHVAFNLRTGEALSCVVTRDMIEEARKKLSTIDDKFLVDDRGTGLQSGDYLHLQDSSFLPIGVIDRNNVICPKTSYYPTPLHGVFGPFEHVPAPLNIVYRNNQPVYPMLRAVEPYGSAVHIADQSNLAQHAYVAFKPLMHYTKVGQPRIFTNEEAILGVPELKFRSIPRNTAAGYPYNFDGGHAKFDFFGESETYDLTGDKCVELLDRVELIIDMARKGERSCVIFNDFLKDELRSPAKVEAVATRLISSAPLDYVVAWRRLFGHFSALFMTNHTKIGMAPGICAYTDWEQLYASLTSKGAHVFAGDFKGFDSSEQPSVHKVILDFINEWYNDGPENALARRVLWEDLVHSRHLGGDGKQKQNIVYQWNKSLPSGHPFTTIVNSMYSLLLLVACYGEIMGSSHDFWDKVFAITYGDDNVVNVSPDVADKYNQSSVAKVMWDKFRMVYTSDDKSAELIKTTTIDQVSFLKRRFYVTDNFVNAPLELTSFLYTCYWCKNKRLQDKILVDVLETALEELSLHPPSVWEKHAPEVYAELHRFTSPKARLVQSDYLSIVRSRADNWY